MALRSPTVAKSFVSATKFELKASWTLYAGDIGEHLRLQGPKKTIQVRFSGASGNVDLQVSNDAVNWTNLLANVSAGTLLPNQDAYLYFRPDGTDLTAGTAIVDMGVMSE